MEIVKGSINGGLLFIDMLKKRENIVRNWWKLYAIFISHNKFFFF